MCGLVWWIEAYDNMHFSDSVVEVDPADRSVLVASEFLEVLISLYLDWMRQARRNMTTMSL